MGRRNLPPPPLPLVLLRWADIGRAPVDWPAPVGPAEVVQAAKAAVIADAAVDGPADVGVVAPDSAADVLADPERWELLLLATRFPAKAVGWRGWATLKYALPAGSAVQAQASECAAACALWPDDRYSDAHLPYPEAPATLFWRVWEWVFSGGRP